MAKAKCDECIECIEMYQNRIRNPKTIPPAANFICNDCEKYLCSTCITKHVEHSTFALEDKSNKTKLDEFCEEMMTQLTTEGDQTLEKLTHICDIVDVLGEEMRLPRSGGTNVDFSVADICILRESNKWAVTDWFNKCIKVFNINNNRMTGEIKLAYQPYGITEIPSTDPSQSLIAISYPYEKLLDIMNTNSEPAQVISSFSVEAQCCELAYCNNKLITRCSDFRAREWQESIHVMNMSGEIINTIDLGKLPDFKVEWFSSIFLYIHSESDASETIYVRRSSDPSCMISLTLDGKDLHYVKFTDIIPRCICADRDQNVYVTGHNVPLYKLSPDLSQKETHEEILYEWSPFGYQFSAMACHADTLYIVRSDGHVAIIRHE